jgi:hypothetical protein
MNLSTEERRDLAEALRIASKTALVERIAAGAQNPVSAAVERIVAAHMADAWDEGHATAKDYDLSDPLDRQEWEQAYVHEIAVNPYRAEVSS